MGPKNYFISQFDKKIYFHNSLSKQAEAEVVPSSSLVEVEVEVGFEVEVYEPGGGGNSFS